MTTETEQLTILQAMKRGKLPNIVYILFILLIINLFLIALVITSYTAIEAIPYFGTHITTLREAMLTSNEAFQNYIAYRITTFLLVAFVYWVVLLVVCYGIIRSGLLDHLTRYYKKVRKG